MARVFFNSANFIFWTRKVQVCILDSVFVFKSHEYANAFMYSTLYSFSVRAVNILGDERNVGTVLFDRSSVSNHCWTNEEFVMLSSRKMFQDLLPKVFTPITCAGYTYVT